MQRLPKPSFPCEAKNITGVYGDLALNPRMSRGALVLALGLFGVCFTVEHSRPNTPEQHSIVSPRPF